MKPTKVQREIMERMAGSPSFKMVATRWAGPGPMYIRLERADGLYTDKPQLIAFSTYNAICENGWVRTFRNNPQAYPQVRTHILSKAGKEAIGVY